ncbi:MAG: ketoacyl-ACP synthase III [Bacteroidales bacterium]|nr:ketoacyl-ACP synthase III [Bacteroidales bacterium]
MNISTVKGVRIEAIAACVPENKVDNFEFAKAHFKEDMTSNLKALGVLERRVAVKEETTAMDFCVAAAEKIFAEGGVKKEDIGAVIFVTLTPDCLMPNNSTYAQYLLGLDKGVATFDINHACPGYVFGLWNAALIAQNTQKKVLLLDGDINSKYVSPWDKNTALLFGDAGTASVISPDANASDWHFTFMSDGSNREAIMVRLGMRYSIKEEYLEYKTWEDGGKRRFIDMEMNGRAVFDYVVDVVPDIANAFMEELETSAEEYEKLVLHQANHFMLKKLAKALGFDHKTQMPVCMNKYGNTSSVSIPLTIASEFTEPQDHIFMIGMGAGLASGIADLSLKKMKNLGVSMKFL